MSTPTVAAQQCGQTADIGELVRQMQHDAEHLNETRPWPDTYKKAARALTALEARCAELEKERDGWKANHDEMVTRNAVLRDRPDLPADRLPAIARLEATLRDRIERVTVAANPAPPHVWRFRSPASRGWMPWQLGPAPDDMGSWLAEHEIQEVAAFAGAMKGVGPAAKNIEMIAHIDHGRTSRTTAILSALASAPERVEAGDCDRCQGNGEIVADWERYRHPHDGDVGDEAVAECPDCNGRGHFGPEPDDTSPPAPVVTDEMFSAAMAEAERIGARISHGAMSAVLEAALESREAS